jgi:hypothetical protein
MRLNLILPIDEFALPCPFAGFFFEKPAKEWEAELFGQAEIRATCSPRAGILEKSM